MTATLHGVRREGIGSGWRLVKKSDASMFADWRF
jgi:hypothetical protein